MLLSTSRMLLIEMLSLAFFAIVYANIGSNSQILSEFHAACRGSSSGLFGGWIKATNQSWRLAVSSIRFDSTVVVEKTGRRICDACEQSMRWVVRLCSSLFDWIVFERFSKVRRHSESYREIDWEFTYLKNERVSPIWLLDCGNMRMRMTCWRQDLKSVDR